MSETKNSCRLPDPNRPAQEPSRRWPWLWVGLGLTAVAMAYFGTQSQFALPETVTGGLGIVGLILLFGGLGATGGGG